MITFFPIFILASSTRITAGNTLATSPVEEKDLLWFAQVTDLHVGSKEYSITDHMIHFLFDLNEFVKPSFIVNTGDLVDGDYVALQPILSQWELYNASICLVTEVIECPYFDLPGNHDNLDNNNLSLFKQYSHLGRTQGTIHASWMVEKGDYTAVFVGISTADTIDGEKQYSFEGRITEGELAFLKTELEQTADVRIVFGHHSPVETDWGYDITDTPEKEEMLKLLEESGTILYANGHLHKERIVQGDGILFITADNWEAFRLFVVDLKRGQTSSIEYNGDPITWPLIVPVFPINSNQVVQPQEPYPTEIPVQVLVFSASPVVSVTADLGNGNIASFSKSGEFLWNLNTSEFTQLPNDIIRIRAADDLGRFREIPLSVEHMNQSGTSEAGDSSLPIVVIPVSLLAYYILRRRRNGSTN